MAEFSQRLPEGMSVNENGEIEWSIMQNIWTQPSFLALGLKITGISCVALFVLYSMLDKSMGVVFWAELYGIIFAGVMVMLLIGWAIMCAVHGGRQIVEYRMSDTEIVRSLSERDAMRNGCLFDILYIFIANSDNMAALDSEPNTSGTKITEFAKVKQIKEKRKKNMIVLKSGLTKNRIFTTPAQYDFVLNYINVRCS